MNLIPVSYPSSNDMMKLRYNEPMNIYDVYPPTILDRGPVMLNVRGIGFRNADDLACQFEVYMNKPTGAAFDYDWKKPSCCDRCNDVGGANATNGTDSSSGDNATNATATTTAATSSP